MAIVSIEDLFDRAGQFEERLVNYYAAIRDQSKDDGVRLLTYYLSRHRRHLQDAIADFEKEQIERIKKIKLKYDIEFYPEKEFHLMDIPPQNVTGEQLLEAAIGYDLELIALYKGILNQPLVSEAAELIESLIKVEERDIVMNRKMIATHYF